ncbi:MAG: hypothetical protein HY835_07505 [Anaerolineae bacterium]|nr:hypothetical protein [Anaerolineae bacterium]
MNDFKVVEQINDLLAGSDDVYASLSVALEIMLKELNCDCAALQVRINSRGLPFFWVYHNLPPSLRRQVEDPSSRMADLVHQLMEHPGTDLRGNDLGLSGYIPASFQDEYVGGLYLWGKPITPEELPRWELYVRTLSRMIVMRRGNVDPVSSSRELLALQMFSNANTDDQDPNLTERAYLMSLQVLFEAEDVVLVLLDEKNPHLAVKKQLGYRNDWVDRTSVNIQNLLYFTANEEGNCYSENLCSDTNLPMLLTTVVGVQVENVICSNLSSGGCTIGAVVLLNPLLDTNDHIRKGLLDLLSVLLTRSVQSQRNLFSLRVAVADLEASRWEIINSRNTLRTLFDSIPSSVYIVDRAFTLISVNIKRSNRIDKHPSEQVGRKCYEQLYHRSDPCPACRVYETFSSGVITTRFSRDWIDQDRFIEWEITTFPIQEKTNLPHQVIIFEQDVTERRNLEANLIQSEKLAAVGQLAAGVAHEINNPLAAIIANSQILKRELPKDQEDAIEAVTLIESAGLRASQVVSNLLSISRKEKKYEFELLNLNETLLGALSLVNHEIVQRSIEVNLDLQNDLPEILASKNHLQGVWINIIVNGIDAIDRADGRIGISTRYRNGEFRVVISDNGKGIPEMQLSRIFEPFYTTKSVGKGTGLGLSVCLRVIKEHKGNIYVESKPEKGTTFTITLPDMARRT